MRNTFYDNAQIKTKYNQSPLYQMTKKEKIQLTQVYYMQQV